MKMDVGMAPCTEGTPMIKKKQDVSGSLFVCLWD